MAPLDGLAAVTTLSQTQGGQVCANTVHISQESAGAPPSPADLATLANDWKNYFEADYRALLPVQSTLLSIKVAQVPDPSIHDDPYSDYLLPINVAGTRTLGSVTAPAQACICVSLKTNSGQRSYRGHQLLPPGEDAAQFSGNAWSSTGSYYEAAVAYAALLQTGCGPSPTWTGTKLASYTLSIYSRTLQTRSEPSVTGCVAVVANLPVHWLRSRARGTT